MTVGDGHGAHMASELLDGEQVLWSEKPDSRGWFYPEDLALVPLSLLLAGFAIFWEASVLAGHEGTAQKTLFLLWGIPFVLIGLYLVAGRLFARRWVRRRASYVLTDRRVLSFSPSLTGHTGVKMVWLSSYPPLQKHVGPDGYGTLCMGPLAPGQRWLGGNSGWPGFAMMSGSAIVLADIPDVDRVYRLLAERIAADDAARRHRSTGARGPAHPLHETLPGGDEYRPERGEREPSDRTREYAG